MSFIIDPYIAFPDLDPITSISGLQFYINKNSIDSSAVSENDAITIWEDLSGNGYDVDQGVSGNQPTLHIDSGTSERQVTFVTDDFLQVDATTTLDFTPQTDEFTIVVKVGESITASQSFGYMVAKAANAGANRAYAVYCNDSDYHVYAGGTATTYFYSGTPAGDDLIIATFASSSTGLNVYVNGTQEVTNGTIGTGTSSSDFLTVGARRSGSSYFDGDIALVAIYNKVLNSTEIGQIETTYSP